MSVARRVLWISPKLPFPLLSGDKIRQYNLIRRLAAKHSVHLIAFIERPEDREFVPALQKYCECVTVVPLPLRWPLPVRTLVALDPRTPFSARRCESPLLRRAITQATSETAFDVVQIEHIHMAQYFSSVAPGSRAAKILTLHNVDSLLTARCGAVEPLALKRLYWQFESKKFARLEQRWLHSLDAVITMSEQDREFVARTVPGSKPVTVDNGVDVEEYDIGSGVNREQSVVFTGSLSYPPNADGVNFFLKLVWPLVRSAVPQAACNIVGRDPSHALMAQSGKDGIVVTGPVEDVRPYLARAGVVVVPLRAGGGTRLKILEAMATGNGIVSTRLGAEGLDVRDGRDLVLADEPESFAQATIRILTDVSLRQRLGTAARRRVEDRYDWRFAAEALDRVYESAVEGI